MKILVIADEESRALWDYYTPDKVDGVDLIISCGDLDAQYLEFLATMTSLPVLYVPGNHDTAYVSDPPGGCENIDGRIYIHQGLRIMGLGGSMKYKGGPYQYTEKEMRRRIFKAVPGLIKNRGLDILVTHAPAKGCGDMEDLPHRGYECFNHLIFICRPVYMLHGHVHASYTGQFRRETPHPYGTVIVNGYDKHIFEFREKDRKFFPRFQMLKNLFNIKHEI